MRRGYGRSRRGQTLPDPGAAKCKAEPGVIRPEINKKRCEGKGACAEVCPYGVFEIGRMDDVTFDAMPTLVKFKLWAHGRKTAYTPHADACKACGLCVAACPERAIKLVKFVTPIDNGGSEGE